MALAFALILELANLLGSQNGKAFASYKRPQVITSKISIDEPVERQDVDRSMTAIYCADKQPDPYDNWALGIFDAQLDGRFLESSRIPSDKLREAVEQKAKSIARLNFPGGYAFGVCPGGLKAWALSMPAATPLRLMEGSKSFMVPIHHLAKRCTSWTVDYVKAIGGPPRQLQPNSKGLLDIRGLERGGISLTCQPRYPTWAGPVLWYLMPVGGLPDQIPPMGEELSTGHLGTSLASWIQKIRAKEGLRPLIFSEVVSKYADLLAVSGTLQHNKSQQAFVERLMKESRILAIGEDRVQGSSAKIMAWLLWNSPRHRRLLLDPQATLFGIGSTAAHEDTLAVVMTGRELPSSVAQKERLLPQKRIQ
jgi:hypothetical protein